MIMMNPSLQYQLVFPTVVLCIITVSFYIIGNAFADAVLQARITKRHSNSKSL